MPRAGPHLRWDSAAPAAGPVTLRDRSASPNPIRSAAGRTALRTASSPAVARLGPRHQWPRRVGIGPGSVYPRGCVDRSVMTMPRGPVLPAGRVLRRSCFFLHVCIGLWSIVYGRGVGSRRTACCTSSAAAVQLQCGLQVRHQVGRAPLHQQRRKRDQGSRPWYACSLTRRRTRALMHRACSPERAASRAHRQAWMRTCARAQMRACSCAGIWRPFPLAQPLDASAWRPATAQGFSGPHIASCQMPHPS